MTCTKRSRVLLYNHKVLNISQSMTREELHAIQQDFTEAMVRIDKAGFDNRPIAEKVPEDFPCAH